MVPQPPYVGQRFESFAEAKEFYQTYAKFHGFAVNTEYHRKIKKTNEYSRGIEEVFPLAVHRHCRWHIIKKAEETLGPFFADRPDLHKAFELCVDHSLTVEEFERSWMAMIETYQVQDHETFASLWEKRMYWVPAYFMQCFFPFLHTTQRSEGFNAALKRFQEEIKRASMYTAFQVDEHTFKVCSIMGMSDSEPEDPDKGWNNFVKASISEGEYYCQCCKFERDGIVCCHILKVMDLNAVTRMPRHFIRRRWAWDADDALAPQTSNAVLAVHDERPESTMEAVRHVVLTKNYAELIDEACKSDETAKVAEKHRKALKRELHEIKKRKAEEALHRFPRTSSVPSSTGPSSENSEVGSGTASTQIQVRNPPRSITKGRPKELRYKSGLEIQAKHKKPKKGTGNP
ncbi:protein FAR1-RELATED SEQUENCE 5-like [Aegilops tauschii subsp. strangulata]|uniref:protein FAR1-RELATED SEQUENCE 5-like n=1 Tax=Aegilops tauschii subsp. strangulata TaxID=200361 RepID=UPI003CC8400F